MAVPSCGAMRIQIIGHLDAAGADHVLRHQCGIAGDVRLHEARQQPRLEIVAAADIDADIEVDGLAAIEVRDLFGARATLCRCDHPELHQQQDA